MHESIKKLVDGNKRFAQNKSIHPNRCEETRNELLKMQKPFVAVLSCSDSRVPIEIIFDAGLGDIFAVRTAGHVLSKEVMGSLEYAVKALGVKVIMVLGHENCGAVKTAIETFETDDNDLTENIQSVMQHIYPAIEKIGSCDEDFLNKAIRANIRYQIEDLSKKDHYIAKKVQNGEIALIGAIYSLAKGTVEILE